MPFGLAVAADRVFVVGNWPLLPIGDDEKEEEENEDEGEMDRESRLLRNEEIRQRVCSKRYLSLFTHFLPSFPNSRTSSLTQRSDCISPVSVSESRARGEEKRHEELYLERRDARDIHPFD